MTTTEAELIVGARAPDLTLQTPDGSSLQLSTVWSKKPVAMFFLGPLDGAFASDYATLWRDADEHMREAGGEIAAICGATPEEAEAFRERWDLAYPLLCATGEGYAAFGVSDSQPGSFVIDDDGTVRYAHRNGSELDNPPTWDLIEAVGELTGQTVERPELLPIGEEGEASEVMDGGQHSVPTPGDHAKLNFTCAKCGHSDYEVSDMSTTSGMMSRMVNLQNRRFSAVSCRRCSYTELYKTSSSALRNVFDVLIGA